MQFLIMDLVVEMIAHFDVPHNTQKSPKLLIRVGVDLSYDEISTTKYIMYLCVRMCCPVMLSSYSLQFVKLNMTIKTSNGRSLRSSM